MAHGPEYSLMIHGGSSTLEGIEPFEDSMVEVTKAGQDMLADGQSAVDAVTEAVRLLEDNPLYNAGRGSKVTADGEVEMDASIMDGSNLEFGAVAGIRTIRNPIALARLVMDKSDHAFMIGSGAEVFAREHGVETEDPSYFITQEKLDLLHAWLDKVASLKPGEEDHDDHYTPQETEDENFNRTVGTVGAVARDVQGNLAAATSTGGLTGKKYGRVGDSALPGAGTFADNESAAVSGTGKGEHFIRTLPARGVAELIKWEGLTAQEAADAAVDRYLGRIAGRGGLIVVDFRGNLGAAHSTNHLLHAQAVAGEEIVVRLKRPEGS